jgi:hypothetical protein
MLSIGGPRLRSCVSTVPAGSVSEAKRFPQRYNRQRSATKVSGSENHCRLPGYTIVTVPTCL